MNNIFLFAGIISIIFFIIKFVEMRVIDKESKPLKLLIRDSLVVYVSVVSGNFIVGQLEPFIVGENVVQTPNVFVDNPAF
jgi:hypothetical protein